MCLYTTINEAAAAAIKRVCISKIGYILELRTLGYASVDNNDPLSYDVVITKLRSAGLQNKTLSIN